MRILFISTDPYLFRDVSYGALQRTHLLLSSLSKVAQVDICSFTDSSVHDIDGCRVVFSQSIAKQRRNYRGAISRILSLALKADPEKVFRVNREMASTVDTLVESGRYDYIAVRYLQNAVLTGLTKYADRLIIDFDDNPVKSYIMLERIRGGLNSVLPCLRALPLKRAWKSIQKRCAIGFYANQDDAVHPSSRALNNVPTRFCLDEGQPEGGLLFVGQLNYPPNRDGVNHFLEKIWPDIIRFHPDLTFRIAGLCNDIELIKKWNSHPGVSYLGFVKDIDEEYRRCSIAVAPIYKGAGTNIKVLEAMAMGRPCVTTVKGFEGFGQYFTQGVHLMAAKNDRAFAKAVLHLLDNRQEARSMAHRARSKVEESFSLKKFEMTVTEEVSKLSWTDDGYHPAHKVTC